MTRAYEISRGEKVILLGEGNFSFSKDFLILNENLFSEESNNKTQIVSTCRENLFDNFSQFKQENILYLQSKGVSVLFNVDATNIKCHPAFKDKRFNKIIFNFPHVGGKMRLDLNRKLLRDIFSSAVDVLEDDGCVVVALCDGQGGTDADRKKRHWNDSWQVTEMAAQSDLILFHIEPFDVTCFPNYVNVGYRSGEKSFHCENAVVHVFRKQDPPRILQEIPDLWVKPEGNNELLILDALNKYLNNPWSHPLSTTSYIHQRLLERLGPDCFEFKDVQIYTFSSFSYPSNRVMDNRTLNELLCSLQDIFSLVHSVNDTKCSSMVKLLMCKKPLNLKEFTVPPVKCQSLLIGLENCNLISSFINDLLELHKSSWQAKINNSNDQQLRNKISLFDTNYDESQEITIVDMFFLSNGTPCHLIHIDEIAQILFKIQDWRSLWDGKINSVCNAKPTFQPTVLFPKEYAFDLGLSVPLPSKDDFENNFYLTLWLVAGDIIVKVEHLTTYLPSDRELICYCYRITYKSHTSPLYRKRVIYFHEKIIAKIIAKVLKVNIT